MKSFVIGKKRDIGGVVKIPSSKSLTNRALIIAVLTSGKVLIKNPLESDDTRVMINCLKKLGIKIQKEGRNIAIIGDINDIKEKKFKLDSKLSGTTIRFLLALSTIISGQKILTGDESLTKRPIGELAGALKDMGAEIEYLNKSGFPPILVKSSKLKSRKTILHGDISSQFISALLLISPAIGGIEIQIIGEQISKPYIDMTIDLMKHFGVKVENYNYKKYLVLEQKYSKTNYKVEGDFSSAGYFLAIAALNKTKITLESLNKNSKQADKNFLKILENIGSKINFNKNSLTIVGGGVKPINIDMENCPDQVQTLAVLLAFAKGKSKITGVRSLRIKETERVLALQNELLKMGIRTESSYDSLTIFGGNPKGAEIYTYNDHRMAMSFAVAGTMLDGMIINNVNVVSKTFPEFWEKLESIGVEIKSV